MGKYSPLVGTSTNVAPIPGVEKYIVDVIPGPKVLPRPRVSVGLKKSVVSGLILSLLVTLITNFLGCSIKGSRG